MGEIYFPSFGVSYSSDEQTTPSKNSCDINRDEIIDKINSAQFNMLIPSLVLVLVTMIVGISGNVTTLIVYFKKMRRTASRVFVIALAFCDLINCTLTMPVEIAIICRFWSFDQPVVCSIGRTLTYILSGTSALLLIGIAVDRYRKICQPLKPVFTPKITRYICFVSAGIGSAVYIAGFFIYGTQTASIKVGVNTTVIGKTCLISDSYVNTTVPLYILSFWFFLTLGVMAVLIVLYSLIGRAVYIRIKLEKERHNSVSHTARPKSAELDLNEETSCSFDDILGDKEKKTPNVLKKFDENNRNKLSEMLKNKFRLGQPGAIYSLSKKRESKRIRVGRTTIMLFSVTIAFMVCFLPFLVIVALRSINPNLYSTLTVVRKGVWNFFLRSYVLNCAVNPLLYGFCNKDYRKKVGQLFKSCLK